MPKDNQKLKALVSVMHSLTRVLTSAKWAVPKARSVRQCIQFHREYHRICLWQVSNSTSQMIFILGSCDLIPDASQPQTILDICLPYSKVIYTHFCRQPGRCMCSLEIRLALIALSELCCSLYWINTTFCQTQLCFYDLCTWIVLTAKFGTCWGRPVWPVGPTGQVCTVRVELDFL